MRQNIPLCAILSLSLMISSCVQAPVFKNADYALVESNYPIVAVNGTDIEKTYRMDIEAGDTTLTVVYNTYQYDYFCTFSWAAAAGTAYEITDHENAYPLTLYRWHRKNSLWSVRLEPVDPLQCTRQLPDDA
ncbi:MAG: hypothetical protein IMF14_05465 [Proteobacteria bacterium]|nr:hypothetical protein [Pseudomonadota bacterium]